MLLTLALIVFCSSILIFFSDEFIRLFKKIFAIKGALLLLPLLLASWIIYTFDFWFLWAAFYLREVLLTFLNLLTQIIPFKYGAQSLAQVILLTTMSVVPVLLLNIHSRRKTHKGYKHPYLTSCIIWILCVVLLIIL